MILSWCGDRKHFGGPGDLDDFLARRASYYNPGGTQGISFLLGPGTPEQAAAVHREEPPPAHLRVDMDRATGCGALRWYDGDLMAVEEGYEPTGFGVWDGAFVPVPFEVGRVSFDTARRVACEYAATLARPSSVSWVECPWMT